MRPNSFLALLPAVLISACLLPVQSPSDGGPLLPNGEVPKEGAAASIVISGISQGDSMVVGQARSLQAIVKDSRGTTLSEPAVTWQSNQSLSASTGQVVGLTASNPASSSVTATTNTGISATVSFTVTAKAVDVTPIVSLTIATSTNTFNVGDAPAITVDARSSTGGATPIASGQGFSWILNQANVVTTPSFSTTNQFVCQATGAGTVTLQLHYVDGIHANVDSNILTFNVNAPTPAFGSGAFTATWRDARNYTLSWPASPTVGATYNVTASNPNVPVENVALGTTSSTVAWTTQQVRGDWTFQVQVCSSTGSNCSEQQALKVAALAANPGTNAVVVLAADGGIYSIDTSMSQVQFHGVLSNTPTLAATAPRADAAGNLVALATVNQKVVAVFRNAGETGAVFNASATQLTTTVPSCSSNTFGPLGAFGTATSTTPQLVTFFSSATCFAGTLTLQPFKGSGTTISTNVTSAAPAGPDWDHIAYASNAEIFTVTPSTTGTPVRITDNMKFTANGTLLGTPAGIFHFGGQTGSATLTQFPLTSAATTTGQNLTLAGSAATQIDRTKPAFGLRNGQLIFQLTATPVASSVTRIGVGTLNGTTVTIEPLPIPQGSVVYTQALNLGASQNGE